MGESFEIDPLADEPFIGNVFEVTKMGLQDGDIQKMIASGSLTTETMAWFAVIHEARATEKPLYYTQKSREISTRITELLKAENDKA